MKYSMAVWLKCDLLILGLCFAVAVRASEAPDIIDGAVTIDAQQAFQMYQQRMPFIDVRGVEQWQIAHIPKATHMDLNGRFVELAMGKHWETNEAIIIYGNSSLSYRSAIATYLAVAWGFEKVYYFREGFFSWISQDYPIHFAAKE